MDHSETIELVSAMEAAAVLGTTRLRVMMLIKEGMLKGVEHGGEWLVDRESLACFKAHGGDATAKRTCRSSCGRSCGGLGH